MFNNKTKHIEPYKLKRKQRQKRTKVAIECAKYSCHLYDWNSCSLVSAPNNPSVVLVILLISLSVLSTNLYTSHYYSRGDTAHCTLYTPVTHIQLFLSFSSSLVLVSLTIRSPLGGTLASLSHQKNANYKMREEGGEFHTFLFFIEII